MAQDMVQIERAELRRIALRRHERPAHGGTFVPSGGSCVICKGEWGRDKPEDHAATCPLFVAATDDRKVPDGIRYCEEHDNFYDANRHGMGTPFYETWKNLRHKFPT